MRISDAYSSLTAAYNDWSDYLANPNYIHDRKHRSISWGNRSESIRIKGVMATVDVLELANKRQFSFQMTEDGSLIQIFYAYNESGNKILSASLGFYSAKSQQDGFIEEELMETITVAPLDSSGQQTVPESYLAESAGWFRIDYDPLAKERGVIHHDCHMHLSNLPQTRFVVAGLPTPRQFIEFVIAGCYPESYKSHCLRLVSDEQNNSKKWEYTSPTRIASVNTGCVPFEENNLYSQISHFRVPSDQISRPLSRNR